jgi:hypothetical protein
LAHELLATRAAIETDFSLYLKPSKDGVQIWRACHVSESGFREPYLPVPPEEQKQRAVPTVRIWAWVVHAHVPKLGFLSAALPKNRPPPWQPKIERVWNKIGIKVRRIWHAECAVKTWVIGVYGRSSLSERFDERVQIRAVPLDVGV